MLIRAYLILSFLTLSPFAYASPYDKKIGNIPLYKVLKNNGAPAYGIEQVFAYLEAYPDKIKRKDYATIVNYTQKSTEPRLYLINLNTGSVDKMHVAHGINSGVLSPKFFSNIPNSFQSSLGFYRVGERHYGPINGHSLKVYGLQKSNSNAYVRDILIHGADYVSAGFIAVNGRLGWSQGCFAIPQELKKFYYPKVENGSLLFAYHDELISAVNQTPMKQELPKEENYGPEVNPFPTELELSKSSK